LGSSIVSVYECDEDDESDGRVSSITGAGRWLVSLSLWAMLSRLRIHLVTVVFSYFWYGGSILLLLGKNRTVPPRSGSDSVYFL
jgi:predicted alternative tryptophan synthase beta-subunit